MAYSNAWRTRAYQQPSLQGTVPALEHREPVDTQTNRNWQNAPENPPLVPIEQVDRTDFTVDSSPGGLVFFPPGHSEGVGYGAGLDFASSQAQNDYARSKDDGSYGVRRVHPMVAFDGEYHVDRQQMVYDEDGIRPAGTPDLPSAPGMSQGLNRAEYPNRYTGHYISRWRDRVFERRNWNVEFRPIVVPNSYSAPDTMAVPNGNQYTSPYAMAQTTNVRIVNTTSPQLRRTPSPWDESITQDGTTQNAAATPDYGFGNWGL